MRRWVTLAPETPAVLSRAVHGYATVAKKNTFDEQQLKVQKQQQKKNSKPNTLKKLVHL